MSEGKNRRVHTAEFKGKVGLEAVRGVKTVTEIAQEYGVHPVLVGQWKKEILENAGALFDAKRGPKPVDENSQEDKLYGETVAARQKQQPLPADTATAFTTIYDDIVREG